MKEIYPVNGIEDLSDIANLSSIIGHPETKAVILDRNKENSFSLEREKEQ